jgi:hypothetical protein
MTTTLILLLTSCGLCAGGKINIKPTVPNIMKAKPNQFNTLAKNIPNAVSVG